MRRFILAFQFLTIFQIRKSAEATPETLSGSMAYFPVVGVLQGLLLAGSYILLDTLLPESVIAGAVLAILALTNGGLHLDGFTDTVDGLAGGATAEDRLRIMRDSASGAVGVAFLVFMILLKYLAIRELPHDARIEALILFPAAGRWAMVPMACLAPYARKEGGLGEAFAANSRSTLLKATAVMAVLSGVLLGLLSLLILIAIGVLVYLLTMFFKKRLGGVTGDVFGFQSEVAELFFLLSVIAMAKVLSYGI